MGSLTLLFSDVFDLSLLEVLTLNQLKRSLCLCICQCPGKAWTPHPSGVSISLLTLVQLSSHPKIEAGRVSVQGTAFPGQWSMEGGREWAFSGSCSMRRVGDCLRGKPGMASVWLGHPSGLACQHGSPELD